MLLFVLIPTVFIEDLAIAATPEKKIRVVLDQNYPPYSFRDQNGSLQGISVEQWNLFSQKTGMQVELTGMEWNKAYEAMLDGQFDVIDTISYNSDRDNIFDFTEPYATIDVVIFFNKELSGITDVQGLKDFTVGAKKSDNAIRVLESHGINNIKVYDSAEAVVKAAKDHEISVFAMGKPPSLYYLYKLGIENQFRYSDTPLYSSQFYRAVKQGNVELLSVINSGFHRISDQEYRKINEKWYGKTNPSFYNSEVFRVILLTIITAAAILTLLLIWNGTLKRRVRQKTQELSRSLEKLSASEARIRALLEATPDMFFLYNRDGFVLDYHSNTQELLATEPDKLVKKCLSEVFPEELERRFAAAIREALDSGKIQTIEYSLNVQSGVRHFEARLVACSKDLVVAIVRDITERKLSEEKLLEISIHDGLTGLYNRYYFENEIAKLQAMEVDSLFIAIFDLDGLKIINDTLGHHAGDQYLVNAAKVIVEAFPVESIISRIGGDEICVLLMNQSKEEGLRCIDSFNQKVLEMNRKVERIPMSVSVGSVFSGQRPHNIMEMIKEADNHMYRLKLHRRQSVKSEVVQMMKNMLEARDFVTEGHVSRMEELAVALAIAVGIPEKDIADIRLLAQFHDIGKVGIPDHILFKPAKLNDEEFKVMKRHTEIGHRIAVASNDLLPIADYILKHHEYWDGKGYPFGLKGEEIPIECRILSIVDAYDAMTNDRPYRKAISKEAALRELRHCSGSQFDPTLVEAFVNLLNKTP
ncbi:MAG: transporter substrate-binding domain-containing protein [Clostridia bacterium]|nr:transporter substrate-binding domain-containing protein [Clostridia bacterium]